MRYENFNQITKSIKKKAKELISGDSALIFKLKRVQGEPQVTILMTKLDTISARMPDIEKRKFITRFSNIIPNGAKDYIQEYNDQFNATLVELLGWGWLKERYPSYNPQFNHPQSPDLLVYDNDSEIIACMECKHIRTSNEEREIFNRQSFRNGVVKLTTLYSLDESENPFLRKLKDTICKAEQQVNQSRTIEKFIFLNLSLDVAYMPFGIDSLIKCFESDLNNKGIKLHTFTQFSVDIPIT